MAQLWEKQPFFHLFKYFYTYGLWAVQFFWVLSGFVFFHVYAPRQTVSVRAFFNHRFSRLFPLHLITLLLITGLQLASWHIFGKFQIYAFNDIYHFFLNLFMASNWGFEKGPSFNAPIWSISVELLTYVMFFTFLKTTKIRLTSALLWFAWSLLLYKNAQNPIFQCAALFALGGVAHQINAWFIAKKQVGSSLICAGTLIVTSIVAIHKEWIGLHPAVLWSLFPLLVWFVAALDEKGISSGKIGITIGSITYASYLLHVPIQITIIIILDKVFGNRGIINSRTFFVLYMFGVLSLSYLTYRFIELPLKLACQKWIGDDKPTTS